MQWGKTIRWTAVLLSVLIVVVIVSGYFAVKSRAFREYVLHKVEAAASQSTGGRIDIGSLDLNLSPLVVRLGNITVHGTEPAGDPPLCHIDELTVGMSIRALLEEKINLSELLIAHPVAHVRVDARGSNNIPQSPTSQSHTSVFDLAIGQFVLSNGEVYYNDKKTPVDASLYDLKADVTFDSAATAYKGTVSYSNGQLAYAQYAPIAHSARLQFTATPSKFSLESAQLTAASSTVSLNGDVTNFNSPTVSGIYDVRVRTQGFAAVSPELKPAGDVHAVGTIHYENENNQPFLRGLTMNGQLESAGLSAVDADSKLEIRELRAQYNLTNGNLRINGIEADTLGGKITAHAEVRNLDTTPATEVKAALHDISLRSLQKSLHQAPSNEVVIAGTLNGTAEASWKGSVSNIRARSDLTIRADAKSVQNRDTTIPVNAVIHALYDGASSRLTLTQSNVRAPSLTLTADGEVSQRSSLRVHAQADDLHQLEQLAASFGVTKSAPPISGSATVDATVQGSLHKPHLTGKLSAANLHVQGSDWQSAGLSFDARPSQIAISNGTLVNANQGRASFDANIALRNWSYNPDDPIRANLNVQRLAIADLQRVANVQYPVSGDLSAHLSVTGSESNPSGSGSADIANGRAYGETIKTFALKFQAANGSVTSNLNVSTPAGAATTTVAYMPKTKTYKLKLDVPSITLQNLHTVHGMKGTASASASGEGTLDNPQVVATVRIPTLEVQEKTLGPLNANLQVANKRANLDFESQVLRATLKAHAQVDLTGEYQTDASIDSGAIPLEALLPSFSSNAPQGFQGQTEFHATLKGPLKDTKRLEAHIAIPTLTASYQQLQIASAGPIHADYANSTITLQPAEIRGTDTSLKLQGSIPLAGSAQPTMTAQGSVDMKIIRIFAPDVRSSGTVALDIHAAGSPKSPSVAGQIRLQNIAVATTAVPLGVENLNGTVNIDKKHIQISEITAQVGGGQVSLGGGITYSPQLQFALALQGKSVRLLYPAGLRTMLDGNIAFSGNMQSSSLNGRVLIDSLSFTPDFDISTFSNQFGGNTLAPAQPGFADNVKLNVSVQSKENLSANSSQVSIEGSANLNVTGTAADPVITGRTELTSGELFYRGNRYQLQRGVITFADPNQTTPNVNVSVATTVEQYNITINLRGTVDRLTTTYESDPPLATTDVIHLIAFGNTASEASAASAGESTDAMVASSVIGTGLSSGVQKLAGFSSLQIDPLLGGSGGNPSARIALQQRVTKDLLFTFSTDVSQPGQEIVQGDYQINQRWSVNVTRDQVGGIAVSGRLHTKF